MIMWLFVVFFWNVKQLHLMRLQRQRRFVEIRVRQRLRGRDTLRRVVTEETRKQIEACFRKIGRPSTANPGMERNGFTQFGGIDFPELEAPRTLV